MSRGECIAGEVYSLQIYLGIITTDRGNCRNSFATVNAYVPLCGIFMLQGEGITGGSVFSPNIFGINYYGRTDMVNCRNSFPLCGIFMSRGEGITGRSLFSPNIFGIDYYGRTDRGNCRNSFPLCGIFMLRGEGIAGGVDSLQIYLG